MLTILERTKQWQVSLVSLASLGTLKALGWDSIAWTSAMTAMKNWQVPRLGVRIGWAPEDKIWLDKSRKGHPRSFFSGCRQSKNITKNNERHQKKHTCGEWKATHQNIQKPLGITRPHSAKNRNARWDAWGSTPISQVALLLLHRALQQDVPADAAFYGAALESCAAAKRWQIAVQLLEELGGDDVVCSLYLISISCYFSGCFWMCLFVSQFWIYGSQCKTLHSFYLGRNGQYVEHCWAVWSF